MKLGYILLAHEPFLTLKPLLDCITENDDIVVLHYDKSTPHADDIELINSHYPNIIFAKRETVEWGEASIVQATLNAIDALLENEDKPDYVTLLSGSCFPIQSRSKLIEYLMLNKGDEFIECHDIAKSQWVQAGLEWARWELFHFYNWRKNPRLFSLSEKIQRKLGIKRSFPFGDGMYMGSQWWTLSLEMLRKIQKTTKQYKLMSFVNRTWIPDEFFFQTLTANLLVNNRKIKAPLMHHRFSDTGIPKIFTEFDQGELFNSDKFFARKIHYRDAKLLGTLSDTYLEKGNPIIPIVDQLKTSLEFHWYKDCAFNNFFQYCPLPIVIIIEAHTVDNIMPALFESIKQVQPKFSVYGDLFSVKKIDFNGEPTLGLYKEDDVIMRDYDRQEFISHVALQSNSGFVFKVTSRHLDDLIDTLKHSANVLFIDQCINISALSEIKDSQNVEQYLSGYRSHYWRNTSLSLEGMTHKILAHFSDNLYLQASQKKSDIAQHQVS